MDFITITNTFRSELCKHPSFCCSHEVNIIILSDSKYVAKRNKNEQANALLSD